MKVQFSGVQESESARGHVTYSMDVWHDGLNKHRQIKDSDLDVLRRKASALSEEWTEKWATISTREAKKSLAAQRTREAEECLQEIRTTLKHALLAEHTPNADSTWRGRRDTRPFKIPRPKRPVTPIFPKEPSPDDPEFIPNYGFFDRFSEARRIAKEAETASAYKDAHRSWTKNMATLQKKAERADRLFQEQVRLREAERAEFLSAQRELNASLDRQRSHYRMKEPEAVDGHFRIVLSQSQYPEWMPHDTAVQYNPTNATLLVAFSLPAVEAIPRLQSVTYVQSRDSFREKTVPESQVLRLYDSLVYQVALRTVHEVFSADEQGVVESAVFNGYVTAADPRTGKTATSCILSLQTSRDEFSEINLAQVDPRACFKALKGVGSSKLHALTAIAPIMDLTREDGRFVSYRNVMADLDNSINLAAMDWEEFEHLIREVFEQEFRSDGGEVKITQASRDGGVDAVAFDPDPIRGGKIVIQAKRYTNTVGVAAVRDLYGTVLNEGATKGVLVTTSDYGPDAYGFAKDKPLVLMNGANLLHLLEKHGHKAQIDIKQAKEALGQSSTR